MPLEATPTPPASGVQPPQPQLPLGSAEPVVPSPTPPPAAPVKPEGLPDRYFDPATGLRVNEVVAALATIETESAKTAEAFKDFPEKPDDAGKFYVMPEQMLPEGVSLPEGVQMTPNQPLLDAALPILHKHRIPREAFHDLVRAFNANELADFSAATAAAAEDRKKLGANGPTRIKAVIDGLTGMVGADKAKFIDPNGISAQAVEFFEALLAKFTTQSNVVPLRNGQEPPPPPTQSVEQRWYPNTQKAN